MLNRNCFFSLFGIALFTTLFACFNGNDSSLNNKKTTGDLDDILKKGKLTVLLENSSTSYFIYRGKVMGFEYELLKEFADELGVELEVRILHDLDEMIDLLNKQEGDLVGCNLTFTKDREKRIDFSAPYIHTPQVLIQGRVLRPAEKSQRSRWFLRLLRAKPAMTTRSDMKSR